MGETLYGPWDYREASESYPYDDTESYRIAGRWLSGGGAVVEDWGCGTGWAKQFIRDATYVGVDGAWSKWADKVVDLREYRSDVPRILMRHVLEHNPDWRKVARNFMDSWKERAALILFIPPHLEDTNLGPDWAVPDLAISGPDLIEIITDGADFEFQQIWYPHTSSVQWGWEGIFLLRR